MGGTKFNGWIVRLWTETSLKGWKFKIERYDTEQEAIDAGGAFTRNIKNGELAREYEIYKDYI